MHELSLANNIVKTVVEYVPNPEDIANVVLKIGASSGVIADAITFAFDVVKEDSVLSTSQLIIQIIPIGVLCKQCQVESTLPTKVQVPKCPLCGGNEVELVAGREFEIDHVVFKGEREDV